MHIYLQITGCYIPQFCRYLHKRKYSGQVQKYVEFFTIMLQGIKCTDYVGKIDALYVLFLTALETKILVQYFAHFIL